MIAALAFTPLLAGMGIAALNLQPSSQLWVEGMSNVRGFKCTAQILEADVATTRPDAAAALKFGEKAVTSVVFRVPAAQLDCKNGQMNDHMRKAIKATANPTIAFELGTYELLDTSGTLRAKLAGTLSLGGVTKPITVDADLAQDVGGALRVKGVYDLRMSDFGLKAPSLMMGTMKVQDVVKVNFDLVLKS
jgi:polyisoprenoid-binding protein YceI